MKNQIFLQARMGSTRLPGKVLMRICGKSIIEIIVERLRQIKNIDKIILTTSINKENEKLVNEAEKLNIDCFQGSEENILDRFYKTSLKFNPDNIIRITGDCPLIDLELINRGIEIFAQNDYDILSNAYIRTYPDGLSFEIFSQKALKNSWEKQRQKFKDELGFDKTFINPVINILKNKNLKRKDLVNKVNLSDIRITLDYEEDFEVIKIIYENLYKNKNYFNMRDIIDFVNKTPGILGINKKYNLYA